MKWVATILMGILFMGCATNPVVTNRQIPSNQHEIDKKMKPVITQRELSENQFEITMKTGSENYLQGCIELMNYGNKLCREKGRISIRRTIKNGPDTRGYNPIWTQVLIIECFPKGVWIKKNGDESERQKDVYECTKDLHLYRENAFRRYMDIRVN